MDGEASGKILLPGGRGMMVKVQGMDYSNSIIFKFQHVTSHICFLRLNKAIIFKLRAGFKYLFRVGAFILSRVRRGFSLRSNRSHGGI